ncbi:MAG TPA: tRNA (adenosine(37)-N6)-threonylcarbamoyltransferase complex ATPase subunit type 1 TsaE [Patescibacteria group bacterium]|nr:tRNA (adenosine(37)-N6)-threonylcarbamoyltransferase complex ATPase subunit type 1 TsaE [Patescibacteria group bacterium]
MSNARSLRIDHEEDMRVLAVRIAQLLKIGDVLTLQGDLGAGKTVFARALVNALAPAPEEVPSPTFTLVQVYDHQTPAIWHFDLYRLEDQTEILELGWDEARRGGVAVVEWPERLGSLLPKDRLEIGIEFIADSENARQVTFTPYGKWIGRQKDE